MTTTTGFIDGAIHLSNAYAGRPDTTYFSAGTTHHRGGETMFVLCDHGTFRVTYSGFGVSNRCTGKVQEVMHSSYDKDQRYTLGMNVDAFQTGTWGVAIYVNP